MKERDFEWLCENFVVPHLPGFASKGQWLVRSEARLVLSAVKMDPSAFSKEQFGLYAVPLALYCIETPVGLPGAHHVDPPKDADFYTWSCQRGDRAHAKRVGEVMVRVLRDQTIPWLAERDDPAKLLAYFERERRHFDTEPALARISALSAAAMGDHDESRRIIARHDSRWRGTQHDDDPVVNEVRQELRGWLSTIDAGPEAVRNRVMEASKKGLRDVNLESHVVLRRPEWWPSDEWEISSPAKTMK